MKKIKKPLILLIYIDTCVGDGQESKVKNTGSTKECLEGVTSKLYLLKDGVTFDSVDDLKTEATWKAKKMSKDLVPLYDTYEVADANVEASKYTTGTYEYETEKGVKKMTAESYLSVASHSALKSYQNSDYNQVIEVTEKNEILAVMLPDGKVKGQDITSFLVEQRSRPVKDKPAFSLQTITFRDKNEFEDNAVIAKPNWKVNGINGIFQLAFEVVGVPTTSEIKFKALKANGVSTYDALQLAEIKLSTTGGAPLTINSLVNANGVYTITGAANFINGSILSTVGVVNHDPIYVESFSKTITIA